jgi:hypothetical protein
MLRPVNFTDHLAMPHSNMSSMTTPVRHMDTVVSVNTDSRQGAISDKRKEEF